MPDSSISRRSLLAIGAALPLASSAAGRKIPVGLELSAVRNDLARDPLGTIRAVARLGYESVEFWMPYFYWTPGFAKEVRKLLDDLGLPCHSTLGDASTFSAATLPGAIQLNQILGSKLMVMTDPEVDGMDDWKRVADRLNHAAEKLRPLNMQAGYHNHEEEFTPVAGRRPIDVIAAATAKDVVLQLDTGNAMQGGGDPVAFIEQYPGRVRSMHCKDWKPAPKPQCYFLPFGEGKAPWGKIFRAAENVGGIEYYLIEQGNVPQLPPLEQAGRSISAFRRLHDA